jgi:hypothetical protein
MQDDRVRLVEAWLADVAYAKLETLSVPVNVHGRGVASYSCSATMPPKRTFVNPSPQGAKCARIADLLSDDVPSEASVVDEGTSTPGLSGRPGERFEGRTGPSDRCGHDDRPTRPDRV